MSTAPAAAMLDPAAASSSQAPSTGPIHRSNSGGFTPTTKGNPDLMYVRNDELEALLRVLQEHNPSLYEEIQSARILFTAAEAARLNAAAAHDEHSNRQNHIATLASTMMKLVDSTGKWKKAIMDSNKSDEHTRYLDRQTKPLWYLAAAYPLFYTDCHTQMFETLLNKAYCLLSNQYFGKMGINSSCMVGVRGVGKTRTLRSLTIMLRLVCPNIVPVYVNFVGIQNGTHKLALHPLADVLSNALDGVNNEANVGDNIGIEDRLLDGEHNQFLLLFVDELDLAYRVSPSSNEGENLIKSIATLQGFGNSETGRVCVVLSGSSMMIPTLIKTNVPEQSIGEYPLAAKAPNINGNKFKTWRIHASPPVDLKDVACIAGVPYVDHYFRQLRVIAFMVGNIPRNVESICTAQTIDAYQELCADLDNGGATMRETKHRELQAALLDELYDKNEKLLKKLAPHDVLDQDNIENIQWESEFKPLGADDVFRIWNGLIRAGVIDSKLHLSVCLEHLGDRSWIHITDCRNGVYQQVWPHDVLQVIRLHRRSWWEETKASLFDAKNKGRRIHQIGLQSISPLLVKVGEMVAQKLATGAVSVISVK